MASSTKQRPLSAFSPWARGLWIAQHEEIELSLAEATLFERALRFYDLSDQHRALAEAEPNKAGRVFAAHDKAADRAATQALRHWKAVGFKDDPETARRPGRPSGDAWSPRRAAGERARLASLRQHGV
jgi:hypothetical protein